MQEEPEENELCQSRRNEERRDLIHPVIKTTTSLDGNGGSPNSVEKLSRSNNLASSSRKEDDQENELAQRRRNEGRD